MTKTTIQFDRDASSAVEASLDALALAITWAPDGADVQAELESARSNLGILKKRMREGREDNHRPNGHVEPPERP